MKCFGLSLCKIGFGVHTVRTHAKRSFCQKRKETEKKAYCLRKKDHRLVTSEQEITEDKALSALPIASR